MKNLERRCHLPTRGSRAWHSISRCFSGYVRIRSMADSLNLVGSRGLLELVVGLLEAGGKSVPDKMGPVLFLSGTKWGRSRNCPGHFGDRPHFVRDGNFLAGTGREVCSSRSPYRGGFTFLTVSARRQSHPSSGEALLSGESALRRRTACCCSWARASASGR